jgi:tRNA(Ile)-lysidine synthase
MVTEVHQQVLRTVGRYGMFSPGDRVGIAVSGGADSVALLRLLEDVRNKLGITLLVLHLNHSLRGSASDADEQFVAELARDRGLQFVSAREDVTAEARLHGWNLEDAARRLRYAFFARIVESGSATRVAVAHTADDQAETVIARLIRGTGLTGLGAIYPVVGHVVRPLLEVRRRDLRDYLAQQGQPWREDETNLDTRRLRARLRHELLPVLECQFSPGIVERLCDLARLARGDEAFWVALVEDRFQAHVKADEQGLSVRISDLLHPFPLACPGPSAPAGAAVGQFGAQIPLTQRLIRRIFAGLPGERGQLTAGHVEQVIHLATECSSGHEVHLPGGLLVKRNFEQLVFCASRGAERAAEAVKKRGRTSSAAAPYEYQVRLPQRGSATVSVPELGKRFRLKVIDWPLQQSDTKLDTEALDVDRLRAPLVLRNWRPGDAYRPRGRRRVQKLKELFLAGRIAVAERARWPVLTSAGKLVWARGLPVAEGFTVGARTRMGLVIFEEGL